MRKSGSPVQNEVRNDGGAKQRFIYKKRKEGARRRSSKLQGKETLNRLLNRDLHSSHTYRGKL